MDGNNELKSSMLEVEPYLVELIVKLADMRTPISTSQGLFNKLIKGTSESVQEAVKFDVKIADEWCNYSKIYKDFCSAGVACEHPEPAWRNENGDIFEKEEEAFRCKSQF